MPIVKLYSHIDIDRFLALRSCLYKNCITKKDSIFLYIRILKITFCAITTKQERSLRQTLHYAATNDHTLRQ